MAGKSLVQGRGHWREYTFVKAGNRSVCIYEGMDYVHMRACGVRRWMYIRAKG